MAGASATSKFDRGQSGPLTDTRVERSLSTHREAEILAGYDCIFVGLTGIFQWLLKFLP
jgi:hypothetical protein